MLFYTINEHSVPYDYSVAVDAAVNIQLQVKAETFSEKLDFTNEAGITYKAVVDITLEQMNRFDELHSIFCKTPVLVADFAAFEEKLSTVVSTKLSTICEYCLTRNISYVYLRHLAH